jgi:hypothetical protein
MEKDIAVNRIVRDMKMGGIICEDCLGEVRKYVDLAWVAGYENGRKQVNQHGNKPIGQYDKKGKLVNTFKSRIEAARMTHFSEAGIKRSMEEERPTKQGWIWKYLEKNEDTRRSII